ncbi:dUTP diphosphatase [Anoxybacillus kestanbolensis]|uniref:dUTP diphosphatase n=1 Tax=Anoxybacillus kestanbolensis TaxID=227476 RepID=UPI003D190D69
MNLSKLFDMQRKLDERIIREKGLDGQNLLPNKVLALQVELAELANEWQGFKHWKTNQQPKEGMLEEYVDCLHFILSIGLSGNIGTIEWEQIEPYKAKSTIQQFIGLFEYTSRLLEDITVYVDIWSSFIGLGEMLEFTWDEVEAAYMRKNAVNHHRQESGY